jgi:hypothetical protein
MAVDQYTKLVLTVIAVCLVWLSLSGPALITPVSAQADGVLLRGWVDETGAVLLFPKAPLGYDCTRRDIRGNCESRPRAAWSLPVHKDD